MSVNRRNPLEKQTNIHEEMKNYRKKAIELAKNHVDVKPIKFLLK